VDLFLEKSLEIPISLKQIVMMQKIHTKRNKSFQFPLSMAISFAISLAAIYNLKSLNKE
jgi:hypothetical protein